MFVVFLFPEFDLWAVVVQEVGYKRTVKVGSEKVCRAWLATQPKETI